MLALIRHSRRDRISAPSVEAAYRAQLTKEGRQRAFELGELLAEAAPARLFYSPVPRCHDTAVLIRDGIASRGVDAELCGPRPSLGADFVRDSGEVVGMISRLGLLPFLSKWFARELDPSIVAPPREAAQGLVADLFEARRSAFDRPGLELHVSHDLVVLALLGLIWDEIGEGVGPASPWYLDGVSIEGELGGELAIWYQGGRHVVDSSRWAY